MSHSFKVGDRVILDKSFYLDDPYNPLWNGKHGCIVGTIEKVGIPDSRSIRLTWDNGTNNVYRPSELTRYTNRTSKFAIRSISI